jgi:hypothetical protein
MVLLIVIIVFFFFYKAEKTTSNEGYELQVEPQQSSTLLNKGQNISKGIFHILIKVTSPKN